MCIDLSTILVSPITSTVTVVFTDASGDDDADRVNRVAAMDAMVSKANTRNKDGFVVAFSEIENVKPGGITGITVTLDS